MCYELHGSRVSDLFSNWLFTVDNEVELSDLIFLVEDVVTKLVVLGESNSVIDKVRAFN
jgi:hypothetical protein